MLQPLPKARADDDQDDGAESACSRHTHVGGSVMRVAQRFRQLAEKEQQSNKKARGVAGAAGIENPQVAWLRRLQQEAEEQDPSLVCRLVVRTW